MEALARRGFAVEVFCGAVLDVDREVELAAWLAARGWAFEARGGGAWTCDALGTRADDPPHFRLAVGGVEVTVHRSPTTRPHPTNLAECREFLRLYDAALDRFRPEILLTYGGSRLNREILARAKGRGIATVFALHTLAYRDPDAFSDVDAVLVASRFAADHYRRTLGLCCTVLPNLVDFGRVRPERHRPTYVTFVNPLIGKGAFAFARIADELGRRRPDIPLLVVESRGTEATLAACGLDLRIHGNVFLMEHTHDPRQFWRVSRLCLMPSLWQENQPLVAIEALINGIPVIGSDRGGLPETLGRAGVVLPLPERLTPTAEILPTPEEVSPWVETIIRLWDDGALYADLHRKASVEALRWAPEILEPQYARFFNSPVGHRGDEACPSLVE